MKQLDLIGRPQDSSHSIKLTTFAYDENLVIDIDTELCWLRNADLLNMKTTYNMAVEYIEELNRSLFLSFSDWRLPTQDELLNMVSYATDAGWGDADGYRVSDYFNNLVFNKVRSDFYWSCAFSVSDWICGVSMSIGRECYCSSRQDGYVWPVRAKGFAADIMIKVACDDEELQDRSLTKAEYKNAQSTMRKARKIADEKYFNAPIKDVPIENSEIYEGLLRYRVYPEEKVDPDAFLFHMFSFYLGTNTWRGHTLSQDYEIWFWSTEELSWECMAGRGGLALVKNGKVIEMEIRCMN